MLLQLKESFQRAADLHRTHGEWGFFFQFFKNVFIFVRLTYYCCFIVIILLYEQIRFIFYLWSSCNTVYQTLEGALRLLVVYD